MKPGRAGISRLIYAMGYSWKGIRSAFKKEAAFRQELGLLLVLLPCAIWLGETYTQMALLIFSLLLVLIIELANSALEAVVDRFGDEWHELSGDAKDMGSAAVLIALINVVVVWVLVALQVYAS